MIFFLKKFFLYWGLGIWDWVLELEFAFNRCFCLIDDINSGMKISE